MDKLIEISKELPPLKQRVRLFKEVNIDCGSYMIWESTGIRVSADRYSIKYVPGLTFENSLPTHWTFLNTINQ